MALFDYLNDYDTRLSDCGKCRTPPQTFGLSHLIAGQFDSLNDTSIDEEVIHKNVIKLKVNGFSPEDITVKIVDINLVINCKHSEKEDESNGWVTRYATRKFELPPDVDIDSVKSSLSSANILTVEFDKIVRKPNEGNVINIPVTHERLCETLGPKLAETEANAETNTGNDATNGDNEVDDSMEVSSISSDDAINEANLETSELNDPLIYKIFASYDLMNDLSDYSEDTDDDSLDVKSVASDELVEETEEFKLENYEVIHVFEII